MARWKVTAKHYIHAEQYGQSTEWERQEINGDTGRMFRKLYKVPMFIDPDDPQCINKHEGICVVARKGTEHPGDIVFFGPPTPDMEPLDDGAQAETDSEKHKWINPIDSLAPEIGQEFGKQLLEALNRQVDSANVKQTVSLKGASSDEVAQLKAMIEQQQKAIDQLLAGSKPAETFDPIPADKDPDAILAPPPIRVDHPRQSAPRR
jgi:hypothetical protein